MIRIEQITVRKHIHLLHSSTVSLTNSDPVHRKEHKNWHRRIRITNEFSPNIRAPIPECRVSPHTAAHVADAARLVIDMSNKHPTDFGPNERTLDIRRLGKYLEAYAARRYDNGQPQGQDQLN